MYKPTDVNQDRKDCYRLACFLRRIHRPVSERCIKHSSLCKLQISNTSTTRSRTDSWQLLACVSDNAGNIYASILGFNRSERLASNVSWVALPKISIFNVRISTSLYFFYCISQQDLFDFYSVQEKAQLQIRSYLFVLYIYSTSSLC